jgi:predicted tellurium resistance membrane protein TerC
LLIPLLQALGGVVILYIAIHMLLPEKEDANAGRRASEKLLPAILSILIADLTMSIDNVLAIGALAHGNLPLLVFGLLISVGLLLLASALIAQIISRFWWLMDLAALTLGYLAAQLVLQDPIVSRFFALTGWRATELTVGVVLFVGLVALALRLAQARTRHRRGAAKAASAHAETTSLTSETAETEGDRSPR